MDVDRAKQEYRTLPKSLPFQNEEKIKKEAVSKIKKKALRIA